MNDLTSLASLLAIPSSTDPVRDSLALHSEFWFRGVLGCGILVALGCIAELPETWAIWVGWRRAKRGLVLDPEDETSWHKPVAAIGLLLVILGIVGETICEAYVSVDETSIRAHDEEILGDSGVRAANAELDAANARKETAQLTKDTQGLKTEAENAHKDAEGERLARMKIEERLAWRRIPPQNFKKLVAMLRPFAGSSIVVEIEGNGDLEASTFGADILKLLNDAQWKTSVSLSNIRIPAVVGLSCRFNIDTAAGRAVAEALKTLPGASLVPVHSGDTAVAAITVGLRLPP